MTEKETKTSGGISNPSSTNSSVTVGRRFGRLDSVSIGGIAVFGALAVVLTVISQALVLSFPLLPYLQFDLGELAILLSFFIFGPIPAIVSSLIEFGTLEAIGFNAPVGPPLKLVAIIASLIGIWAGMKLVSHMRNSSLRRAAGVGTVVGIISRVVALTFANYYLIIVLSAVFTSYSLPGIVGYVAPYFKPLGITLTEANGLVLILGATAVFNALQLLFVSFVSYLIVRLPQVRSLRAAGRKPWIVTYLQR